MRKSILITSIIIILISSLIINVNAENLTELSTNDLFIKYPYYLNNAETNDIIKNATDTYNDVMSDYDENDEFISAIKSGSSSSVEVIIRDLGSKLGLMDSYYETCMDTATIELMKNIYADENLIASLDYAEKASKAFSFIKDVSDLDVATAEVIADTLTNLSSDDINKMTSALAENYQDVLDPMTDFADVVKYTYTACIIADVQLEMIDVLMEKVGSGSELYKGLSRLRDDMSMDIVGYTTKTFIENKVLKMVAESVSEIGWESLGIGTGPVLLGQLIVKSAVWVLFDVIYPHPGADEVISNMIHSMYVMELETTLMNQRGVFYSPFFVSDMDDYETVFNVYLAAIKTTLEGTKALAKTETAKQNLEAAKQNLASALPNYDAYLTKCKREVLSASEEERIISNPEQRIFISNDSVYIGNNSDVANLNVIPLTGEGSTYFDIVINNGELIIEDYASIPSLTVTGTLVINSRVVIEDLLRVEGCIQMDESEDYLLVNGDFVFLYTKDFSSLTDGILEIRGNMSSCGGYTPTGKHKAILSGDKLQEIDLSWKDPFSSGYYCGWFNILEITNTSEDGVSIDEGKVKKEVFVDEGISINGIITLTDNAIVRGYEWDYDIFLYNWNDTRKHIFNGKTKIQETTFDITHEFAEDVEIDTCVINAPQEFRKDLKNHGIVTFNNEAAVGGNLYSGHYIELNNANLTIEGDFTNRGTLKMEHGNDYVLVKGDYYQSGASDHITAGVLEIKGDINATDYRPTGTHKTILSGDKMQSVSMCSNYNAGVFNILELANTSKEGITFGTTFVNSDIVQSIGTKLINSNCVQLQNKPAFVDYGELNAEINSFNGNAENVIPTWLDYERYFRFAVERDKAFILNGTVSDTSFTCDLYFSNDYNESSAVVIVAFYDGDNRFVQMASKPVDVKEGKIDVSIDYERKPYSTYKIMVWESLGNLKPLMTVK